MLLVITEKIKKTISDSLDRLGVKNANVFLEHPKDFVYGDYSFAAMRLKIGANDLAKEVAKNLPDGVEKVEAVGDFVNFFLKKEFFTKSVKNILDKRDDFGNNSNLSGKKIVVEYTDANPFKEFHIGHLMSNSVGESIARLFQAQGAEVKRACYQGDVGLHVAKAIFGYVNGEKEWGKAYAKGNEAYETNEKAKKEIEEINEKIYLRKDEKLNDVYESGRKTSLESFEEIYKRLGTKFDFYFFESETGEFGRKIVEKNIGKVFEKSEGAIIFPESKSGLHTRVFLNSRGLPTYEAKELGLAKIKYEKYQYDLSFIITANEINEYFRVLLRAMEIIFPELAKKTKHLSHGMLRLPSGKMSSRTGSVVKAESLIEEVKNKLPSGGTDEVAIGAIKYSILRQHIGGDIIFDFGKSISLEGDSGPYLQYSYARAKSVLAKSQNFSSEHTSRDTDIFLLKNSSCSRQSRSQVPARQVPLKVLQIERLLYRFPEVVGRAASEYAPHYIATYLIELAGAFNNWYARERILDAGEETPYRLALTEAFSVVMKNGLKLLGIQAPEKM